MIKKKTLGIFVLTGVLLFPGFVGAAYVRPNHFMDKKGAERIAEIKRFQARMNLPVTGGLNDPTKDMLTNPKKIVYDIVPNPPSKGVWLAVNKSRKTLTMYEGGKSLGKYPVALGTSKTPTPSGKGTLGGKQKNPAWGGMFGKYAPAKADDPKNPLGERWMSLNLKGYRGYGIHGTIKPWEIGGYVSNGCIRMFNYDIETYVFPKVPQGAPVWIGTDEELASWGVRQIIDLAAEPAGETPTAGEKPEETVQAPVEETKQTQAVPLNTKP